MTYRIAIVILAAFGLALASPTPGPPPPKVINVYRAGSDPALPPLPSGSAYAVAPFAFSPNEQWIGVMLYVHGRKARGKANPNSTILLLPLHPTDGQRVEIDSVPHSLAVWSPDSESVVVQPFEKVETSPRSYNLQGKQVWTGPRSAPLIGFIAPGRLLVHHAKANAGFAEVDAIDITTSEVTPWRAPRRGHFGAIDSARGLVALSADSESSKILIVDYATGKVIQSINGQNQTIVSGPPCYYPDSGICDLDTFASPGVYFAEHGRTLCEVALVGAFKNYPVCQDVDTGKMIAEFHGIDGGLPASVSSGDSRMVVTTINQGHIVWDFRAGTEVAAWRAAKGFSATAMVISPSGKYVAEADSDELRIYQLP